MKVSTRINGRVTSIKVKDSVLALHWLINADPKTPIQDHALDTCNDIMQKWNGTTGKGCSQFITDTILEQMLEPEDVQPFWTAIARLEQIEKGERR